MICFQCNFWLSFRKRLRSKLKTYVFYLYFYGVFMVKYVCTVCGYVYDPEVGDPDGGIPAGTAFEDIPEDWVCPVCGVGKSSFEQE